MASQVNMQNLSPSYKKVWKRIQVFIRKYYLNSLIHGLIQSVLIGGGLFLGLLLFNQLTKATSSFREPAFFIALIITGGSWIALVLLPFFKFVGVAKGLNLVGAEKLIRAKFPEMKDTLLNLIELGQRELNESESSLILASIEEREQRLKWYKFESAVPYKKLLRPAIIFICLLALSFTLWGLWPDFVSTGYTRTIHYKQEFDTKPILEFTLENDSLRVGLGNDLKIMLSSNIPLDNSSVYLNIGAGLHLMESDNGFYAHQVEAINGPFDFTVQYQDYESPVFHVDVIPIPELLSLEILVQAPKHTGLEMISQKNNGDLVVAEGSRVDWSITQQHADRVMLLFDTDTLLSEINGTDHNFSRILSSNTPYQLYLKSLNLSDAALFTYSIEVINDQFPSIVANQMIDSLFVQQVYIQANIEDDYGFSALVFYVMSLEDNSLVFEDSLEINKSNNFQKAYYAVDFSTLAEPGKEYEYYLSVWDNDGINGPKRTDSRKFRKRIETADEVWDSKREKGSELGDKIEESQELVKELGEKLDDLLQSQIIDNKGDWEIKSKVDEISEMKDILEEMIENIQLDNQQLNVSDDYSMERRDEIIKKQKQIEDLFEKILDDELKELFEEFEKLAEEMNQRERLEKTEELKLNLENLEQQLDVNLELLKKLELEKQIYDLANKMKKLGEKTQKRSDSTGIDESKKEFENLEEKLKEQLEKNSTLNQPHELDSLKEERKEISDDLDKASKQEDKKGQQESMQKAGEKMKKLGEKMQNMMSGSGAGNPVDLEMLRQLARELNDFSFKQEALLDKATNVNARNKIFHEVGLEQRDMELKFGVIGDSLKSLAYKEPIIAGLLNEEVFHVETSLRNLFRSVQDGNVPQVRYEQQKVMEGSNELAVRLDELVQNMKSQGGQGGEKQSFTDSKPKENGEELGEMRGKQQSLKEELKGMIQKMKDGQQNSGGNKELAKMLSEREMLRQKLEQLRNSGLLGDPAKKKLDDVQNMMEEVEKDIIYNRVSDNTLSKEEWIQTRLLEAEQSEREREKENKREATEFKGEFNPKDIPGWEEIEKKQKQQTDLMKYSEFKLKKYYRVKYQEYLEKIKRNKK